MYFDTPKEVKLKNGQTLTVRRAEHKDALGLIDYLNTIGGESDNLTFGANEFKLTEQQEIDFIDNKNNDEDSLMLVGLVDGEIVCSADVSAKHGNRMKHITLLGVSVRKPYWRLGIGRAVMNELIEFAKQHERIEIIHLGVRAENTGAISLYEQLGFKRAGVYKNYFKIEDKYYDEILMELHLK